MKKKIAFGPGKQVSAFEAENKNSKSNNVISSLHLTRSPHLCWMPRRETHHYFLCLIREVFMRFNSSMLSPT